MVPYQSVDRALDERPGCKTGRGGAFPDFFLKVPSYRANKRDRPFVSVKIHIPPEKIVKTIDEKTMDYRVFLVFGNVGGESGQKTVGLGHAVHMVQQ